MDEKEKRKLPLFKKKQEVEEEETQAKWALDRILQDLAEDEPFQLSFDFDPYNTFDQD